MEVPEKKQPTAVPSQTSDAGVSSSVQGKGARELPGPNPPAAPASRIAYRFAPPSPPVLIALYPEAGPRYELEPEKTILIGRDPRRSDLLLLNPSVSQRHCKIVADDEDCTIFDLGSSNGTYVNGERLKSSQKLRQGDLLTIGRYAFMFLWHRSAVASRAEILHYDGLRKLFSQLYPTPANIQTLLLASNLFNLPVDLTNGTIEQVWSRVLRQLRKQDVLAALDKILTRARREHPGSHELKRVQEALATWKASRQQGNLQERINADVRNSTRLVQEILENHMESSEHGDSLSMMLDEVTEDEDSAPVFPSMSAVTDSPLPRATPAPLDLPFEIRPDEPPMSEDNRKDPEDVPTTVGLPTGVAGKQEKTSDPFASVPSKSRKEDASKGGKEAEASVDILAASEDSPLPDLKELPPLRRHRFTDSSSEKTKQEAPSTKTESAPESEARVKRPSFARGDGKAEVFNEDSVVTVMPWAQSTDDQLDEMDRTPDPFAEAAEVEVPFEDSVVTVLPREESKSDEETSAPAPLRFDSKDSSSGTEYSRGRQEKDREKEEPSSSTKKSISSADTDEIKLSRFQPPRPGLERPPEPGSNVAPWVTSEEQEQAQPEITIITEDEDDGSVDPGEVVKARVLEQVPRAAYETDEGEEKSAQMSVSEDAELKGKEDGKPAASPPSSERKHPETPPPVGEKSASGALESEEEEEEDNTPTPFIEEVSPLSDDTGEGPVPPPPWEGSGKKKPARWMRIAGGGALAAALAAGAFLGLSQLNPPKPPEAPLSQDSGNINATGDGSEMSARTSDAQASSNTEVASLPTYTLPDPSKLAPKSNPPENPANGEAQPGTNEQPQDAKATKPEEQPQEAKAPVKTEPPEASQAPPSSDSGTSKEEATATKESSSKGTAPSAGKALKFKFRVLNFFTDKEKRKYSEDSVPSKKLWDPKTKQIYSGKLQKCEWVDNKEKSFKSKNNKLFMYVRCDANGDTVEGWLNEAAVKD